MRRAIRTVLSVCAVAAVTLTGVAAAAPTGGDGSGAGHNAVAGQTAVAPAVAPPAGPAAIIVPQYSETSFVPILPCRAIDTRPNRIAANTTVNFHIRGTTGFASQGGSAGGCGVPAAATGVAVSVSSVLIGGVGYFRIWPYGQTDPGATIAHYEPGAITTTGGTVTLGTGAFDVTVKAFDAPAGLVVDITGYYVPTIHATIAPDGTIYAASSRVVSVAHPRTGTYTVTIDRNLDGCTPTATVAGGTYYASAYVGAGTATVTATTWAITSGTATATDLYWNLSISC